MPQSADLLGLPAAEPATGAALALIAFAGHDEPKAQDAAGHLPAGVVASGVGESLPSSLIHQPLTMIGQMPKFPHRRRRQPHPRQVSHLRQIRQQPQDARRLNLGYRYSNGSYSVFILI